MGCFVNPASEGRCGCAAGKCDGCGGAWAVTPANVHCCPECSTRAGGATASRAVTPAKAGVTEEGGRLPRMVGAACGHRISSRPTWHRSRTSWPRRASSERGRYLCRHGLGKQPAVSGGQQRGPGTDGFRQKAQALGDRCTAHSATASRRAAASTGVSIDEGSAIRMSSLRSPMARSMRALSRPANRTGSSGRQGSSTSKSMSPPPAGHHARESRTATPAHLRLPLQRWPARWRHDHGNSGAWSA